jgi:hypothetical protein
LVDSVCSRRASKANNRCGSQRNTRNLWSLNA